MRYAIISDIHANWQAWSAVLQDIQENKADAIVCLGDVVGYGPRPEEVLSSVRQHTANFVIGNHDAAACGLLDASIFNDHARDVVEWTRQRLSSDSLNFLQQVPLTIETDDILFVHAEVADPGRFGYIESEEEALHQFMFTEAGVVFVGHTHKPLAYSFNSENIKQLPDKDFNFAPGHRYLVNVGSVGEPRSKDDIRGRYVLYDSTSRAVYFRKVMFDVERYRQDLHEVGLNIQPYFLSIIDHEASQGRNVFDSMDTHLMSVPDKALFTGSQMTSRVLTKTSAVPAMSNSPLAETELPPPPSSSVSLQPKSEPSSTRTANAGLPGAPPRPAEKPKNKFGVWILILAMVLVCLLATLYILNR